MGELLHIIDRGLIHFTASTTLVLMLAVLLRIWYRRTRSTCLPRTMHQTQLTASLLLFAFSTLREPYDVYMGQSLIKAICDFISWALGILFADWALHRWRYFDWEK